MKCDNWWRLIAHVGQTNIFYFNFAYAILNIQDQYKFCWIYKYSYFIDELSTHSMKFKRIVWIYSDQMRIFTDTETLICDQWLWWRWRWQWQITTTIVPTKITPQPFSSNPFHFISFQGYSHVEMMTITKDAPNGDW